MRAVTIGGVRVEAARGELMEEHVAGVPNLKLGASITLRTPAVGNERYGEIALVSPLPAEIIAAKIVWRGEDGTGLKTAVTWPIPDAAPDNMLAEMKASAGTWRLPTESDLIGALADGAVKTCRLVLRNAAGWGNVRDLSGFLEEAETTAPFVKLSNPVLSGPQTEDAPIVFTPLEWDGDPGVTIVYVVVATDGVDEPEPPASAAAATNLLLLMGS